MLGLPLSFSFFFFGLNIVGKNRGIHSDREAFYRLYILSIITNCCTTIVIVLLAVGLKQAVIHVMSSLIVRKRVIIHIVKMIIICKAERKKVSIPEGSQQNII